MGNELSRPIGKMVLLVCVLLVCIAPCDGAVKLGDKIGPLELTTLDGPKFTMNNYPCIIQTSDGRIHISYTFRRYAIKHVAMNEDWLVRFKRPN